MSQNGAVYFTNTSNELRHVLYSTRIDLHLDSQHHFPPGSWPWSPGAPGGANDTYVISTRDEHGSVICKAPRDACGDSLRAHTKFQRSIRPSWRVVVLFPSFGLLGLGRWSGGENDESTISTRHRGRFYFCNLSYHCEMILMRQ